MREPVGIRIPCAVCRQVPEQIAGLCPDCEEAVKAHLVRLAKLEAVLLELHDANHDVLYAAVAIYKTVTAPGLYAAQIHKATARLTAATEACLALGCAIAERRRP